MGYQMNLHMSVQPKEQFDAVAEAIDEEYGQDFRDDSNDGEGWNYDTKWSGMSEDMVEISKRFPDARITMRGEGEDGQVWCEYFANGKYRLEERPEWEAPEWDDTKLTGYPYRPIEATKDYTVILAYPDRVDGRVQTWMGEASGMTVADAVENARKQVAEDSDTDPDTLQLLAVIEGRGHEDLSPSL